jgi:hypothetical protein
MTEMKSNMCLLWAEVEALNKGRDHLQEHVNHLTKVAKLAKKMPTVSKTFSNRKMDFCAGNCRPSKAMLAAAAVRSAHQPHLLPIPAS